MFQNLVTQAALYFAALVVVTPILGKWMYKAYEGERTILSPVCRPIEVLIYRLGRIDESSEMRWSTYAYAMLAFNLVGFLALYSILRLQHFLPLNPEELSALTPDLAFNTAVSFVTNTNWQAYGGESTLSYFSQMVGLAVQNFLSAATGMAIGIATIRGFTRKNRTEIGNFWVDLVRSTLYVLLPLSVLGSFILVSQGVVQNFSPHKTITTVEKSEQVIPGGPAASQVAIKQLGTNGGGFFNANSAHPLENPTPFSNFVQMLALLALPAGMIYTFGLYARDPRQGYTLFGAAILTFAAFTATTIALEQAGNPLLAQSGADQTATATNPGGNMEGKEVRFGIVNSSIWAIATTAASNGSVNSMHASYTPLGGCLALLNMGLGEVIFGGVGVGLMGLLVYAILSVFIAGLMVGRTPEYLGKKIEAKEVKLAMLSLMVFAATVLIGSAIAAVSEPGLTGRLNQGPHGLSEILYAFSSAGGNNGSAFAGLTANSPFYNTMLGLAMLFGRYLVYIPVLAIAGALVKKQLVQESSGTFPTTGFLFTALVIGTILIVGALTFFPAYSLAPIVQHFLMNAGKLF